ncbi:hypothetical protein Tco_0533944 [Tanacetum coccineum]
MSTWINSRGDVLLILLGLGYRVLIDLILHRSLINNNARLSNKFGGFYFIFKFGISGLLHHVVTTIADKIRASVVPIFHHVQAVVSPILLAPNASDLSVSIDASLFSKTHTMLPSFRKIKVLRCFFFYGGNTLTRPGSLEATGDSEEAVKDDSFFLTMSRPIVIMEYLVKIDQKARILELKRRYFEDYYSDNQYTVSIKEDTAYLCLHSQKTTKETRPIRLYYGMDDPNIIMEEYIKLEEEKAQKRRKVFNWETAKYGKIWYDKDVLDLRSVETEFPAIVFNDSLTSNEKPSCEPTVSSLYDNEIDFRISFDESDDEDYTIVFDKNSFSYKIISTNDLKMDSGNDNEKVNIS